jgi:hypothetical protein
MSRITCNFILAFAVALLLLASAGRATAQVFVSPYCPPPTVSYYPPSVSYYAPPTVTYYSPRVAYYPAPTVTYYAPPAVSYYAAPVTTTRYGLFGRPRVTTRYYYYPTYVWP